MNNSFIGKPSKSICIGNNSLPLELVPVSDPTSFTMEIWDWEMVVRCKCGVVGMLINIFI